MWVNLLFRFGAVDSALLVLNSALSLKSPAEILLSSALYPHVPALIFLHSALFNTLPLAPHQK